jgi:hypothetical protein
MKKILLFLAISFITTITTQAQYFVEYDVNGVHYSAIGDQLQSFVANRKGSNDKNLCRYLTLSVSGIYDIKYTVEFNINYDSTKVLQVDTFKLSDDIAFLKRRPTASLKIINRDGENYKFYSSENGSKGRIIITKVDGDIIEGTFEGELIPQYPLDPKKKLIVTNGKFQIEASMLEY